MTGLINMVTWQDVFTERAGMPPEKAGVKTAAQAQDYLTRLQEIKDARQANTTIDPDAAAAMTVGRVGQGTGTKPTK